MKLERKKAKQCQAKQFVLDVTNTQRGEREREREHSHSLIESLTDGQNTLRVAHKMSASDTRRSREQNEKLGEKEEKERRTVKNSMIKRKRRGEEERRIRGK